MEFLRFEDYPVVRWKNGGGVTRELADHRDGSVHPDFLWRISIATVDRDGPFSRFEDIDRTIAVLAGKGMVLASPEETVTVTRCGEPFRFDGETAIAASLIAGETTDLNAMTRRGCFRHSMQRLRLTGPTAIDGEADETVLVFNSASTLTMPDGPVKARSMDALRGISKGERVDLVPDREAEVLVIRLVKTRKE